MIRRPPRITRTDNLFPDPTLFRSGLSGEPLMNKSTAVLRMLRTRLPDSIPLVGVGGILSGAAAAKKMAAGASLVQCYTGLIYRGPALIGECVAAHRRREDAPRTEERRVGNESVSTCRSRVAP